MAITNRLFLAGRLAKTPEIRYTPQGLEQCSMVVCHNWRGRVHEHKLYVTVISYGAQAKACIEHITKGSPVLVEGHLRSRSWEKQGGGQATQIYIHASSVHFLSAGILIPPADEYPGVELPESE